MEIYPTEDSDRHVHLVSGFAGDRPGGGRGEADGLLGGVLRSEVRFQDPAPVPPSRTEVSADVHRPLDAWADRPAYVRDRCCDVLAANKPARALAPMYEPGSNLVRAVFLDGASRRLFPDWARVAAQTAAALRAEADPRDPRTVRLVAELETDEEFRRLWMRHETRPGSPVGTGRTALLRPDGGPGRRP